MNVLYQDGDQIVPIRTSAFTDRRKHHVTLLMITDNHERFHYLSVRSMSRLVASQVKSKYKCYVCHYCLYPFRKEDQLKQHTIMCQQHQSQQIIYPTSAKDDVLKFTKIHYQFPVPFVTYDDFECFFLEKNDENHSVMHVPSGFRAPTISIFEEHDYKLHCYSGENIMEEFYNYMNHEEQRIRAILNQNNIEMTELTAEQQNRHTMATIYDTCNKEFTLIRIKTKHHCHVTGRYLGPVCQS